MSAVGPKSGGYLVGRAARLFARIIDRRLKPLGVWHGQLWVFHALGNGEALSQKALAEAAAVEQPTIAATLSRMERDGLIERNPDPSDRRSALISLTPHAMEKVTVVREVLAGLNAHVRIDIPDDDYRVFISVLNTIINSLEKTSDELAAYDME